jgi:hypothetical protein
MNYKNFLLIIIFFIFTNCKTVNLSNNSKNIILSKGFSNKGFALVFDQKDYDEGLISKKIDDRSLIIFQKNLKINTQVKIINIINNKYLIAKVGKNASYPLFNNSVISKRIAVTLDLDINEPYIEIIEIPYNTMFVAKKAKTFEEEKSVARKAPVNNISINDLNSTNSVIKKNPIKQFSYEIKIADFFYKDTAKMMKDRIINETQIKNPKIKKITKEKYRVYLGPFDKIASLQKSFNDINVLEFENIEIIKND